MNLDIHSSLEMDPLEQSWKGLEFFNKSHCGRICGGSELERALTVEQSCGHLSEEEDRDEGSDFIIPELPQGIELVFRLLSTWGDPYYLGLNGIEIFNEDGDLIGAKKISVVSNLEDSRDEVPDCVRVENLMDGEYRTRDDTRLWWTAYDPGTPVLLSVMLWKPERIAMIRIWNYNKSRIHASRGVKNMEMNLDGLTIFQGEISKAAGHCDMETSLLSDTILFTTSEEILEKIGKNDRFVREELSEEKDNDSKSEVARPGTGEKAPKRLLRQDARSDPTLKSSLWNFVSIDGSDLVIKGKEFALELTENWGSPEFIGLNGLKILSRARDAITLATEQIKCNCSCDCNLEALCNDKNLSTNMEDEWICVFERKRPVKLVIKFSSKFEMIGIVIWNCNSSLETSYSGVRLLNLLVDGEMVAENVPVRKAPGNLHYDFVQEIIFGNLSCLERPEPYNGILGFVFQVALLSTWGDEFYLGLNGLELFGSSGKRLQLTCKNLAAFPESVNVLPNVSEDPRSSDKLIDDCPDTADPTHMWLAPVLPHQINRIYLVFDAPTAVSRLRLWNYRKTPSRGVRSVSLMVDDVIVFSGEMDASDARSGAFLDIDLTPTASGLDSNL